MHGIWATIRRRSLHQKANRGRRNAASYWRSHWASQPPQLDCWREQWSARSDSVAHPCTEVFLVAMHVADHQSAHVDSGGSARKATCGCGLFLPWCGQAPGARRRDQKHRARRCENIRALDKKYPLITSQTSGGRCFRIGLWMGSATKVGAPVAVAYLVLFPRSTAMLLEL